MRAYNKVNRKFRAAKVKAAVKASGVVIIAKAKCIFTYQIKILKRMACKFLQIKEDSTLKETRKLYA